MDKHKLVVTFDGESTYWKVQCPPEGGCQPGTHCGGCGRSLLDPPFDDDHHCYDCKGVTPEKAAAGACALANWDDAFVEGEIVLDVDSVVWDDEGPTMHLATPVSDGENGEDRR